MRSYYHSNGKQNVGKKGPSWNKILEMSGENGSTPWHIDPPLLTSLNENEGELCQPRVGCLLCLKEAAEG